MVQKSPPGGPAAEAGGDSSKSVPTPSQPRRGRGRLAGAQRKAGGALRVGRNRLEPTVAGRIWRQLAGLGVIDSSMQFAAVFTLGFIPYLRVLSAVLGSGLSRAIVVGSGFSLSGQAGHDVTTLFTHGRTVPVVESMLSVAVAVLGGLAISHLIQTWYAKIFRTQIRGWKAFARQAEWLAGVFGFVTLQVVIGRRIEPPGGHVAAAGAQFLLAIAFWWWSLHCLLSGQIPWRRLFLAGLATAVCCTGLSAYISYVASSSIISNEAMYGPIGAVITLLTAEIGLGVAIQLGAAIGATIGGGKSDQRSVRSSASTAGADRACAATRRAQAAISPSRSSSGSPPRSRPTAARTTPSTR
jgi:hypothetical protein